MKKNLLLIGSILGSFVSGCIAVFGIMLCLTTFLGLTGCSMNVAPTQMFEEKSNIEWVSNVESRAASTTPTWETDKLEYVTIEVYRVPMENKMNNGKEYQYTKKLHRGEKLRVPTDKDYNYEYYSCIRVVEFDSYNMFFNENEIHIFDYDDTVGMEVSLNWGVPLRTKNKGKHNEWKLYSDRILHRDDEVGYEDYFYFLNRMYLEKFYDEHKDCGRIVWDN